MEFVNEALLDSRMSGGVRTFVDGVFNFAGSLKDKIAGTGAQTSTENIE